jgi:hypothetical protein
VVHISCCQCIFTRLPQWFLEVGNNLRKIADDRFPVQNIISTIYSKVCGFALAINCACTNQFWDLGHELFRSTTILFPATLVARDAFDPAFLSLPPLTEEPHPATSHLDLRTLMSLNGLHGHLSTVHSTSLFPHSARRNSLSWCASSLGCYLPTLDP